MTENNFEMSESNDGQMEGPGQIFMSFLIMEDLIDKLKMLNYDREFIKDLKMKALNRHYFAIQTNPGEQFYLFTSLAAWLLRKCGKSFEQPQEYDDPNSTVSSILDALRQFGVAVNFPPSRLKQGYGENAVFVLDQLANQALTYNQVKWLRAEPVAEKEEEEDEAEDEAELLLEKVEEEMATVFSDEDDEDILNLEDLHTMHFQKNFMENQKPEDIMESTMRSEEWQIELERVLPQLKVTIKTDSRDWRNHLQQMQKHRAGIQENLSVTKTQLDKLYSDISSTLEKISSREKYLNSHLEPLLVDYRSKQDELRRLTEQYKTMNSGVTERSKTLARVSEELENVKKEMDDRGSSMTDGTPLINIKKAMSRIKSEINEMNVRIGVLESEILQSRLRDKTSFQMDVMEHTTFGLA